MDGLIMSLSLKILGLVHEFKHELEVVAPYIHTCKDVQKKIKQSEATSWLCLVSPII